MSATRRVGSTSMDGCHRSGLIGGVRRLEDLPREELVEDLRRALARIEELEKVTAELSERLAKLERLVSRNSQNSSTPPSKDDDLGRRPPAVPPVAGRE